MKNNHELVAKLNNDVNKLQNKIAHRNLYNVRNFVVQALLKSGIAIDYALPFILAAIIFANSQTAKGNTPFRINEITEKAGIETMDTSNGIHIEHISYDFNYDDELIEYTTGWIVNDKGLYERTVTSYRLSDEIDLDDTEKILSMSKEELEQLLVITNVKTIKKNTLDAEDSIYNDDAIIVVNHSESETETITRLETSSENTWGTILYIILALCWGNNFRNIEKIFVKTYLRDRLREYEPLFRQINKEELETMKKMLKVKQENLAMVSCTEKSVDNKERHSYRLRRI